MAVKVNQETCIGCGACVSSCPSNFVFNADKKSEATNQKDDTCVQQAIDGCPVQAISKD